MSHFTVSSTFKSCCAALAVAALMGAATQSSDAAVAYGVDSTGNIWQLDTAANSGAGAFTKLTLSGNYTNAAGDVITSISMRGLTMDAAGNLYTASSSTGSLYKITLSGGTSGSISRIGGAWQTINDITTDNTYLYIANGAVVNRVGLSDGVLTEKIGGANWGGNISGVAIASDGTLYFSGRASGANASSVYYISNAATAATKGTPLSSKYGTSTTAVNVGLRDVETDGTNIFIAESDNLIVGVDLSTEINTGDLSPSVLGYENGTGHMLVFGTANSTPTIVEYNENGGVVGSFAAPNAVAWTGLLAVPAAVPEAASLSLLALGSSALLLRRRKA